jgi:hypothetical protein
MKKNPIHLTAILLAITLIQGCATAFLSQAPVTSTKTKHSIFAKDVIRAVGYPEENGERVSGLVLLGDQFSYMLTEGHVKIALIMSELNPKYMYMENYTNLNKHQNKVSGRFNFTYDKRDEYSTQETNALAKLCSKKTEPGRWLGLGKHVSYDCWVYVSGTLFASQRATFSESVKLTDGHKIALFVNEGSKTSVDGMKVADKLFTLPFAVGFDLITSPLQIFLLSNKK